MLEAAARRQDVLQGIVLEGLKGVVSELGHKYELRDLRNTRLRGKARRKLGRKIRTLARRCHT